MSDDPAKAPSAINLRRVGDTLAARRSANYLVGIGERLEKHGDEVLDRFFRILLDPTTSPATFLRFLNEIHTVLAVKDIMSDALALRKKGRPGEDEDPEIQERRKAWAEVLNRYPDAVDAEFQTQPPSEEVAPPKRQRP